MVTVTHGINTAQDAFEAAKRGEPAVAWAELYFQTAYDQDVAPAGAHVMSAFAQYAPYDLAEGDWDSRREEIGGLALDLIETYAPDLRDCVIETEVLGPPDVEERIGSPGGTSSRARPCPIRCGTGAWSRAPRSTGSTSAGRHASGGIGDRAQRPKRGDGRTGGRRRRSAGGRLAELPAPPGSSSKEAVMIRAPRPRVKKLTAQRMKTSTRF